MATGRQQANFVLKKLASFEDFGDRLLGYLSDEFRDLAVRTFGDDGVFDNKIGFVGSLSDIISLSQSGPGLFEAVDGLGNIIDLGTSGNEDATVGQIKDITIENTLSTTYYVSLQFTTIVRGISINPRTALPEYTKLLNAVGVKAAPNSVVDNGGTITFVIDSVCEASHSHAGRTALVYKTTPDQGATTEGVAIETATVAWNGVNNRITTTGVLGQTTVDTDASKYAVVLLGPSVRKVDTSGIAGHAFLGSVVGVGAGGTPGVGDTTAQKLLDQSLSTLIDYPGGPAWADGTTNPATTIVGQITKIITDLVSTSGQRGLGKLTARALPAWHDASVIAAGTGQVAVDTVVSDLADATGGGGADKVGSGDMANFFNDSTTLSNASIWSQINTFIGLLASESGGASGAHKLGSATLVTWADSTVNAAGNIHSQLNNIVFQLASITASFSGTRKVGTEASTATFHDGSTLGSGTLRAFLEAFITALGGTSGSDKIGGVAAGNLSAGSVQDQLQELDTEKAGLALANIFDERQTIDNDDPGIDFINGLETGTPNALITDDRNPDSSPTEFFKIFEAPAGATTIRLFWGGNGNGLVLTNNCDFDNDANEWVSDAAGGTYQISFYPILRGQIAASYRAAAAPAETWGNGAWTNNNFFQLDTSAAALARMVLNDGTLRFLNSSTNTNPAVGTAPLANTLYAKNIPKAWGRYYTDSSDPIVDDGFNFNTATYDGSGNVVITFHLTLTGSLSVSPFVQMLEDAGADYASGVVFNESVNGFSVKAYRETLDVLTSVEAEVVADVKMASFNQDGDNTEWCFMVMGVDAS